MSPIERIQSRLAPLRNALLEHPLYSSVDRLETMQVFMSHHVFAVWDFMSLLKALQRRICCIDVPWIPAKNLSAVRFINEIVLGEESDEDGDSGFCSHFELYHRAMQFAGARTDCVDHFLQSLSQGRTVHKALQQADVPPAVCRFVEHTFRVIEKDNLCELASTFTFGREDLLPDVFQQMVDALNAEHEGKLELFRYYLNRHILLDGDHHGPMAERLMSSLCGDSESQWQIAEEAAVESLQARLDLWNAIEESIDARTEPTLA